MSEKEEIVNVRVIRCNNFTMSGLNCFLIATKREIILIDTGLQSETCCFCIPHRDDDYDHIVKEIIKFGNEEKKKLKMIIITHPHYDHIGNAARLQTYFECNLVVAKNGVKYCQRGKMPHFKGSTFGMKLLMCGLSFFLCDCFKSNSFDPFNPNIAIDSKSPQTIVEGLKIINTPGHSPGDLTVRYGNALFVGDIIGHNKNEKSNDFILCKLWHKRKQFFESLKILNEEMKDDDIVYLNHSKVNGFEGKKVKEWLIKSIKEYEPKKKIKKNTIIPQ